MRLIVDSQTWSKTLAATAFAVVGVTAVVGRASASPVTVVTTSGRLQGVDEDGVMSFKGIRFAQPPVGFLRWTPPVPFISAATQDTTKLGPSCVQQFAFATANLNEVLFNNPQDPPVENEDCLFLNVWAPSGAQDGTPKPVVIWIYGGALAFGTASLPAYDGTSIVENQDIIIVTINYRTNVFGFPSAPDLPLQGNNLGFLDQELAFVWVQQNIAKFGGDPRKVTIMGESAGATSVSAALTRHQANPPFRAGILFSGSSPDTTPVPSFASFNQFAAAVGCNQSPGPARLACLKSVPTATIRAFTNGPTSGSFGPVVDNFTTFADVIQRVRSGRTARVPILLGSMQDDGSLFTVGMNNLTQFLNTSVVAGVPADLVRSLYPGLNDSAVIAAIFRDVAFKCPASLWAGGYVQSGISSVFRYEYGAVFPDLQLFPMAGAWHSTELPELFGTFNATTATSDEVTLSNTFQTVIANFIKNPNTSPAPNWPPYAPGPDTQTLAKLAYQGNVELGDVVMPVQSNSDDGPCEALWNRFLSAEFSNPL